MTERLLFLDYESTGLEWRTKDVVLEIAWTVTDMDLTQLSPIRQAFVAWVSPHCEVRSALPGEPWWNGSGPNSPSEVVRDMHDVSGLAKEWADASYLPARVIEQRILDDLAFTAGSDEPPTVYMAGAGVSHFDQDLTTLHMPRLAPRGQGGTLHYRTFDTSVAAMVLGVPMDAHAALSEVHSEGPQQCSCLRMQGECEAVMSGDLVLSGVTPHRAADDVAVSLAYARMFRKHIRQSLEPTQC